MGERIAQFVCLLVSLLVCCFAERQEPMCTSRFDYEHKMLHKIVMMEVEQTKQAETLRGQMDTIRLLEGKLQDITLKYDKLVQKTSSLSFDGTGSTYIRWGRNSCPGNGSDIVYIGYAAGSRYDSAKGGSNYICLPEEPLWGYYEDAKQTSGTIWGVEYELYARDNMKKFFGEALLQKDVPCAVCQTKRSSVMMIPGRNKCYDNWTLEYSGYLVSEHETHASSDFVCLDGNPEYLTGGINNENGKLMYFVEARCGSLRCPPYVDGRELTCAVCSK